MANLTAGQIKGYASAAGFQGNDLNIAVAVALAESGGNPSAHNPKPPDDSYGLWQINMLGSMGPARRKQYKLSKNEDLYDPATNARVAYGIFKGSGWSAWTTYTRGTYKKYMTDAGGAVSDVTEPVTPAEGASDGGIITGGLNALGANVFNAFQNIGGVIIGVVLIIAAILLLALSSNTTKGFVKKGVKKIL
jgi:hypothetical protein